MANPQDIGVVSAIVEKRERAVATNSPAVAARIKGLRPTYEKVNSHCIVIDLKSGTRTVTNTTPPEPVKTKPLPPPKPAAHVLPPDPEPYWRSTEGLQRLLSREKIPQDEGLAVGDIMQAVCEEGGITVAALRSPVRTRNLAWPRQVAIFITMKMRTDLSSTQVGMLFGGRDHTTCLSARDVMQRRLSGGIHPMCAFYHAVMARLGKS